VPAGEGEGPWAGAAEEEEAAQAVAVLLGAALWA